MRIQQAAPIEGIALNVPVASQPLPDQPYRSLAYYEKKDRALFAGRDDDVDRFTTLLDHAGTRILVLHGESGVGKSSFLHAGVLPYLEDECLGYRFLRDRDTGGDSELGSVVFIRATGDLTGQLAEALCKFCRQPYKYKTPRGETVAADLPGLLREFVADDGQVSPAAVRAALEQEPPTLSRILAALGGILPFSTVLVIDQGEEVFTLAQDLEQSYKALEMLRQTVHATGDFKVIVSLRTEFHGRLIDRLRRGLREIGGIREYLLTDFDKDRLVKAIRLPTSTVKIRYASEVPAAKYGFQYDEGVADKIATLVLRSSHEQRGSTLPLLQVVCTRLHEELRNRGATRIAAEDVDDLGSMKVILHEHVERLLDKKDKKPFEYLLTKLYLTQNDGSLTTRLMPVKEAERHWHGSRDFADLLSWARQKRLLRVTSLGEERQVSLGHDALARLAADWDQERKRKVAYRRWASFTMAIALMALALLVMWTRESSARSAAEQARNAAEQARSAAEQAELRAELANAQETEQRRATEQALAMSIALEGDALVHAGKWREAKQRYDEAGYFWKRRLFSEVMGHRNRRGGVSLRAHF